MDYILNEQNIEKYSLKVSEARIRKFFLNINLLIIIKKYRSIKLFI